MTTSITPFVKTDLEGAKRVVLEGFKDFGFSYNKEYDSDLDDIKKFYIDTGGMFYVLKVDGKIVGTAAVINKGHHLAELKRMYVQKEFQGQGFGSQLLEEAISFCKENGFTKLEFETNKKFLTAHKFYQHKGFRIVSEDERSYYMEKDL